MIESRALPHSPDRCIFLITGIMASGKSTVAQLLAESLKKSVHVRGDAFRRMIVNGREEYMSPPSDEAARQLELRYKLTGSVADTFLDEGFTAVIQDVVLGSYLTHFVQLIRNRPLYVVVLDPNEKTVEKREASRSKKDMAPGPSPNCISPCTRRRQSSGCGLTLRTRRRERPWKKSYVERMRKLACNRTRYGTRNILPDVRPADAAA